MFVALRRLSWRALFALTLAALCPPRASLAATVNFDLQDDGDTTHVGADGVLSSPGGTVWNSVTPSGGPGTVLDETGASTAFLVSFDGIPEATSGSVSSNTLQDSGLFNSGVLIRNLPNEPFDVIVYADLNTFVGIKHAGGDTNGSTGTPTGVLPGTDGADYVDGISLGGPFTPFELSPGEFALGFGLDGALDGTITGIQLRPASSAPALPPRGFTAEGHLKHSDSALIEGTLPFEYAAQKDTVVDHVQNNTTGASSFNTLTPVYDFTTAGLPGGTAASFPGQNFLRTTSEAFELEVPFFPGAAGPVVRVSSTAQRQVGYYGDFRANEIDDAGLTRVEFFEQAVAIGHAISYYRAVALPDATDPLQPIPVNVSYAMSGLATLISDVITNSEFSILPNVEMSVDLKVAVHVNGFENVLFDGDLTIRAPFVNLDDEFVFVLDETGDTFLVDASTSGTNFEFDIQSVQTLDDIFDGIVLVHAGDIVALELKLTTNVDIGGFSVYSGDQNVNLHPTIFGDMNFTHTVEGVVSTDLEGFGFVAVGIPEPSAAVTLLLTGLCVARRNRR